jgi:hypothetical protein
MTFPPLPRIPPMTVFLIRFKACSRTILARRD